MIEDIPCFAGYHVNIEYDPEVLEAVNPDSGAPFGDRTGLLAGDILINDEYIPLSSAANDIQKGTLNFMKTYLETAKYRDSGKDETTGTLGIVGFKVLKKLETKVRFADREGMPNAVTGTVVYDWNSVGYGDKAYKVLQPGKINEGFNQEIVYGDIDFDGEVTSSDFMLINRYILGKMEFRDEQKYAADVDGNNEINSIDSLLIRRYILGALKEFPAKSK